MFCSIKQKTLKTNFSLTILVDLLHLLKSSLESPLSDCYLDAFESNHNRNDNFSLYYCCAIVDFIQQFILHNKVAKCRRNGFEQMKKLRKNIKKEKKFFL